MPWKKNSSKKPQSIVGISANQEGLALTYGVISSLPSPPSSISCEFLPCSELKQQQELLAVAIGERQLEGCQCYYNLAPHEYRLLFLDAPEVAEKELNAAAQWLVKDLIDFPLNEASIDVFQVPVRAGQAAKIYVVVCRKSRLQEIARLVKLAGLKLTHIGIYDLALRNILSLYPESPQGVAVLCLDKNYTNLVIVKEELLYLTRPLDESMLVPIAAEEIKAADYLDQLAASQASPASAEAATPAAIATSGPPSATEPAENQQVITSYNIANLVLEIQRSFNYYQSQMGQATPAKLLLMPSIEITSSLLSELSQNLAIPVEMLDLKTVLALKQSLDASLQSHCIGAIGELLSKRHITEPDQAQQKLPPDNDQQGEQQHQPDVQSNNQEPNSNETAR